jgi:hypothetical protein
MKYDCWDMDCFDKENKFGCNCNIKSDKCQFKAEFEELNKEDK